jgi:tyrosine-protein kinase
MNDETTLGDYLRVIRQRRLFIVLVAVICAAAALGISVVQKKSYDAQASVAVQDTNEQSTPLGNGSISPQTPLQIASAHVPQVTRPAVVKAVKRELHSPLTLDALRASVEVAVDPNSYVILITAHARTGAAAAAIANAFAAEDARLTTRQTRDGYAAQASLLAQKIKKLGAAKNADTKAIYIDQLSRLQSLSTVAVPVQVSTTASIPTAPSSPKPVRNVVAALIFGLLLGIALAYGRNALDRRLRRASDVEQLLPHPIVGHVRTAALGHAGAGSNGRGRLADIDEESFRILRQNVRYLSADEAVRTILVTSAMAQEGKSTVAACLAAANAAAGKRTLLVECDLRRPVLADRLGLSRGPGLTDYLTGHADPREIMQPVTLPSSGTNGNSAASGASSGRLICITSGNPAPRPAELLASERFHTFLQEVSRVYDSVILDSAPMLAVADSLEIIPNVSGVLVCVRLDQTTRDQAVATQAALERLPSRPTAVVVTSVREKGEGYYGYYEAPAPAKAGAGAAA